MINIPFANYVRGEGRSGGAFTTAGRISIYVQRSINMPQGLVITNVDIRPRYQQRGLFSSFLALHKHLPIKLGCVINSNLENWLLRQPDWYVEDEAWIGLSASFYNETWKSKLGE